MAMLAIACACSGRGGELASGPAARKTMHPDHRFDFLLGATRDIYRAHVDARAAHVALVRAALREDAREEVRRNAIVALTAAEAAAAVPDYIMALDDPAPFVASEAAAALATYGPASLLGPANEPALAALRTHAPRLRELVGAPLETARFNALSALVAIADPVTALATVLDDDSELVRHVALELASVRRTLGANDVAALGTFAERETDSQLRVRAVNLVAARAPQLALPVLTAALIRGDADRSTANLVTQAKLVTLVPAILAYLKANPKEPYFFATLADFGATCAAKTIAQLAQGAWNRAFAMTALAKLSGHDDWTLDKLLVWAEAQPESGPPCTP